MSFFRRGRGVSFFLSFVAIWAAVRGTASAASEPEQQPAAVQPDLEVGPVDIWALQPPFAAVRAVPTTDRGGGLSAADLLAALPMVVATGNSRGERSLYVRGFEPLHTALLLDGLPVLLSYDGRLDLGKVPASWLERIDIFAGAAQPEQGGAGLGASLLLQTRRPGSGPRIEMTAEGSWPRQYGWNCFLSGRQGALLYGLGLGADGRTAWLLPDGQHRTNSDSQRRHVLARTLLQISALQDVTVGVRLVDGHWGIPPATRGLSVRYWRFDPWRWLLLDAQHTGRWSPRITTHVGVFANLGQNTLGSFDDDRYASQQLPRSFESTYEDLRLGIQLGFDLQIPQMPAGPAKLTGSTQFCNDSHRSQADRGEVWQSSRTNLLLQNVQFSWNPSQILQILIGGTLTAEFPQIAGLEPAVDGGPLLALVVVPLPQLQLRIDGARHTRFPTLKERFSSAQGSREPNPGLRSEHAWHFGLDVQAQPWPWLALRVAGFDSEVRDLIIRKVIAGGTEQLDNAAQARLVGGEATLRLRPWTWLDVQLGYLFLHARRTDRPAGQNYLEQRPAHRGVFTVLFNPWPWLSFQAEYQVTGPQRFAHPDTAAWGTLGLFSTLSARVEWRPIAGIQVYLRGQNLTNLAYETDFGMPEPGLSVWLGMRLFYL